MQRLIATRKAHQLGMIGSDWVGVPLKVEGETPSTSSTVMHNAPEQVVWMLADAVDPPATAIPSTQSAHNNDSHSFLICSPPTVGTAVFAGRAGLVKRVSSYLS